MSNLDNRGTKTVLRAIGLPISSREGLKKSWTLKFLVKVQPRIAEMGYGVFVGFRDRMLNYNNIGKELIDFCNNHGILWYWHPPYNTAFGIGKTGKLTDHLKQVGESAGNLKDRGMRYILVHPDAASYDEPPSGTGLERYFSQITANEMMRFLDNHIAPGRELSKMSGGKLLWENVHDCLFSERTAGYFFTYYAAQAGYLETKWLAEYTSAGVCFDSEHFYGSQELHCRRGIYRDLPIPPEELLRRCDDFGSLTGYYLVRGYAPYEERPYQLVEVIELMRPKIFHLGGGTSLVNEKEEATSHLSFDLRQYSQRQILIHQITWVEELGGWLEPENVGWTPGYSPRIRYDRQAKKKCFWQAVHAIEKCRSGSWQADLDFVV